MFKGDLGPELELLLLNNNGQPVNQAPELLSNIQNHQIGPEFVKTWIEIGAEPSSDIETLALQLGKNAQELVDVAVRNGLRVVPVTTLGPSPPPEIGDRPFYKAKAQILGENNYEFSKHSLASHVHVDLAPEKELWHKQFTLGTVLDPSFVFMSSSPYYQGVNGMKDMRVFKYREQVHRKNPALARLIPYRNSLDALQEYFAQNYGWLEQRLKEIGQDFTSAKINNEFQAFWGTPRFTITDKKKTVEIRSPDSNLVGYQVAYLALIKGAYQNMLMHECEFLPEESSHYFLYENDGGITKLRIPPFESLKVIEREGYIKGLASSSVRNYLHDMLQFAQGGLPAEESKFLHPFTMMLDKKETLSDSIMSSAKEKGYEQEGKLTARGARQLRLDLYEKFRQDLDDTLSKNG